MDTPKSKPFVILTAIILCGLCFGCNPSASPSATSDVSNDHSALTPSPTHFSTLTSSATQDDLPAFIRYTNLTPDFPVSQSLFDHRGNLWVAFNLDQISEANESLELKDLEGWVDFFIDGREIDFSFLGYGSSKHQGIVGNKPLDIGSYQAIVVIHRPSGNELRYSWKFEIVALWDSRPTMAGLPDGLKYVRPLPGSFVTQDEYATQLLVPSEYHNLESIEGRICAAVIPGKLAEAGDFWDEGDVLDMMNFISVDGRTLEVGTVAYGACGVNGDILKDSKGVIVAEFPGPHCYLCLEMLPGPGEHEVRVNVEKDSAAIIDFTWRFWISQD